MSKSCDCKLGIPLRISFRKQSKLHKFDLILNIFSPSDREPLTQTLIVISSDMIFSITFIYFFGKKKQINFFYFSVFAQKLNLVLKVFFQTIAAAKNFCRLLYLNLNVKIYVVSFVLIAVRCFKLEVLFNTETNDSFFMFI